MSKIFHPLLYLLACATRQELARQVQFLKTENEKEGEIVCHKRLGGLLKHYERRAVN